MQLTQVSGPCPRPPAAADHSLVLPDRKCSGQGLRHGCRGGQALARMGSLGALGSHPVANEDPAWHLVSPGGGHTGHQFHQGHTDRPLCPPAQGERWGPGLSMGVRRWWVGIPLLTLGSNLLRTPRFVRCWVLGALMPG